MGATFALSSVLTPFFMGTVVGAIAAGNVPAEGNGAAFSSWIAPLPLLVGALFVASGAYVAAVFLVADAAPRPRSGLDGYFAQCAHRRHGRASPPLAGLFALHSEARYIFDRLTDQGLPLVLLSALCGIGVLASSSLPSAAGAARGYCARSPAARWWR